MALRIEEIRNLTQTMPDTNEMRLTSAAEALNKAALVLSDCGLDDLARRLSWQQFEIFQAAAPLNQHAAKNALQPLVNLGRLAVRCGDGDRAYEIFCNAYHAVRDPAAATIDGREIDFRLLLREEEPRQPLLTFLWAVLLADGTRALTKVGRWADALAHIERHKGIGKRMLDGRQVAVLAHLARGDHDGAARLLDDSVTPDRWETAVAAVLRTLCCVCGDLPIREAAVAAVRAYLRLGTSQEHVLFRTRLGLCLIDFAGTEADVSQVAAKVIRESLRGIEARGASDVLARRDRQLVISAHEEDLMSRLVEQAGVGRGSMPPERLAELLDSAVTSQENLASALDRCSRRET